MPLLRRRGNMPSETNMRRHNHPHPSADDAGYDANSTPQSSHAIDDPAVSNDLQSCASSASRPNTPPVQEETSRHKRFSVLRFRNASDSQLSLRAKQQAEKPPPVPRREHTHVPYIPSIPC